MGIYLFGKKFLDKPADTLDLMNVKSLNKTALIYYFRSQSQFKCSKGVLPGFSKLCFGWKR